MRLRVIMLVVATSSLVLVSFLIPLALVLRTLEADRAVSTATAQAQSMAPLVTTLPADSLRLTIEQINAQTGARITVILPSGTELGQQVPRSAAVQLARNGRSFTAEAPGGEQVLVAVEGLSGGAAVISTFVPDSVLRHGVTRAWLLLGGVGLLLLVLSVAVAGQLARSVVRPIKALALASDRLAAGDLSARATVAGPPEVCRAAAGLNRLAVRIGELLAHERETVAAPARAEPAQAPGTRQGGAVSGGLWLRFLSGPDIDSLGLTNAEIVAAVTDAVRAHGDGRVVVEPRVHLVPDNDGAGHFNVLRGHLSVPGVSGVKVVGDFVSNYAAGLPSELGLLTLYDPQTGVPLAIMDATMITACRTGAMTAVGARYLARRDARVLGHVGARGTAFWNVVLLDELFDLEEIRITSRRPESREAFARQLATVTGTHIRVASSAEEVFDGADILVEASRLSAPEPLLRTAWVRPGAFVVPYGTVSAVELDLLDVMDKVVVDDWREAQSGRFGALRRHVDAGRLSAASLHAELGQIVTGARPGREHDDERILFWHRGLAILDIAVGLAILRRAEQQGAGTMLRYRS